MLVEQQRNHSHFSDATETCIDPNQEGSYDVKQSIHPLTEAMQQEFLDLGDVQVLVSLLWEP